MKGTRSSISEKVFCPLTIRGLVLATLVSLCPIVCVAQYPKQITLTVTKITRTSEFFSDCLNCIHITTVEAHTATAQFLLICKAYTYPSKPKRNSVCAKFETGTYVAKMWEPDEVSFWPDNSYGGPGEYHNDYAVLLEQARDKSQ